VNGESLLGARHKCAVDIVNSLHNDVLFLICDGYADTDVLQSESARVNHGQEFGSEGDTMLTEEAREGRQPQSEGHEMVTEKVSQSQGVAVQGRETVQEKISQGRGPQCQGHEVEMATVGQGQGLVFEGHVKVNGSSEQTVDEHHRERARQRRLARYCKSR